MIGIAPVVAGLGGGMSAQTAGTGQAAEPTAIVQTVEPGDTDIAPWFTGVSASDVPQRDDGAAGLQHDVELAAEALARENRERMEQGLEPPAEPEYSDVGDPPAEAGEQWAEIAGADVDAGAWSDAAPLDAAPMDAGGPGAEPGGMW